MVGGESEIAESLLQDFWTAIEYDAVTEFLSRLRNRGHRLIARWGEEILLETSGNQRTWSSIRAGSSGSGNEPWNRARNGNHKPA